MNGGIEHTLTQYAALQDAYAKLKAKHADLLVESAGLAVENAGINSTWEAVCDLHKRLKADYDALGAKYLDAVSILSEVYAQLEDNFDIRDGDDGQQLPNAWMSVGTDLAQVCRQKLGINLDE